jgi:glycosyltransferase involved in cell wall biosynthesis
MTALLLALAAAFLALAAHPFTTYPASLALLRRWRAPQSAPATPGQAPQSFSLLVCAHNEERVIEGKIANLEALLERAPGWAEVLVYVDGSSDGTAAILEQRADPRFTVVVAPRRSGKTAGLNRLAALARGEILVLSDANVTLAPDALERLAPRFADPEVGLVVGHLRYVNSKESVTADNGARYWRLEETLRQLESDTGSAIGADGSLYAVRRTLWPTVPDDLIDDFYVPMTIRFAGRRVCRGADVHAFERSAGCGRDEFRRKVRIACQAFNVHRALWPQIRALAPLDRYKYLSHKLLKWLAGPHLLLAAALALAGLASAVGAASAAMLAAGSLLALAIACRLRLRPALALWDGLAMLAAVALGLLRSLQGERFQTWQPADSARAAPVPIETRTAT